MKTVLFLCTGNYYRSRFAEILFNHLADQSLSGWRADSRGLAPSPRNVGPISTHAVTGLDRVGLSVNEERLPSQLTESDLQSADLIVAVQEAEHLPMMLRMFPEWVKQTTFWNVADIEFRQPSDALTELEGDVRRLIDRLKE